MCYFSFLVEVKRGWELSENCFSNLTHNSQLVTGANFHFCSDTLTGIKLHSAMAGARGKQSFYLRKGEVNYTYIGGSFCFGKQW